MEAITVVGAVECLKEATVMVGVAADLPVEEGGIGGSLRLLQDPVSL